MINSLQGSDMLGDLLSRGLNQLVECGKMRIQDVVDGILIVDCFTSGL
jgi:hypothetical protein